MTTLANEFFHVAQQACISHGAEEIWTLATTHASFNAPSGQYALSYLGRQALELTLAWYHIRTRVPRDTANVSQHLAAFATSDAWIDALLTPETFATFRIGSGLAYGAISRGVRKQLVLSVLGGCFLADFDSACNLTQQWIIPHYARAPGQPPTNAKTHLQQYAQRQHGVQPVYAIEREEGRDHQKIFSVRVSIKGTGRHAVGSGPSKKQAEQAAATALLRDLRISLPGVNVVPTPAVFIADAMAPQDVTAWCRDPRRPESGSGTAASRKAVHCRERFHRETGVILPVDVAVAAITHASAGTMGPSDTGLSILGNRAFNFAVACIVLESLPPTKLCDPALEGKTRHLITELTTNRHKIRLAGPWAPFIHAGVGLAKPYPDSVVLDCFEGLLGAATLAAYTNISRIVDWLRVALSEYVDFDSLAVESEPGRTFLHTSRQKLQQLYQSFFRRSQSFSRDVFDVRVSGPQHAASFHCSFKGASDERLVGSGTTRAIAEQNACDQALAMLCLNAGRMDLPTGSHVLDQVATALRTHLLTEPSESTWRTLDFDALPFSQERMWGAVQAAILDPIGPKVAAAVAAIRSDTLLAGSEYDSLYRFVTSRFHEQLATETIQVAEATFKSLLAVQNDGGAGLAVQAICAALYALRLRPFRERTTLYSVDLAKRILRIAATGRQVALKMPAGSVSIDVETLDAVLQQLVATGHDVTSVFVEARDGCVQIVIEYPQHVVRHTVCGPLVDLAWRHCGSGKSGFTISTHPRGCVVSLPIATDVAVTSEGVQTSSHSPEPLSKRGSDIVDMELEAICFALHEVKNAILAGAADWREVISGLGSNLRRLKEIVRPPEPERTDLFTIEQEIECAVKMSSDTYGCTGATEILVDSGVGYVDLPMLRTIIRNLFDNAARATLESGRLEWIAQGFIDTSTVELVVSNPCKDGTVARQHIEGGTSGSTAQSGTGIGVPAVRRLVSRLMGDLRYEVSEKNVKTILVVPIGAEVAAAIV